ncbi:hypothetical protein ANCCEY_08242 [Ancylostoma ceylanicum]|uniref:NAA35-like N-terminal domain-containing protein n=1 Tax=Ancylostoma ceylanicum TaxID=53326 RepID=A0A0D6LN65_9BILA|nr:hypothetical protein ANCCEY_08242 [Ancylostoma ceylanicum]
MTEEERQESDGEREISDSDSEPELDPADYEKRRDLCLRQIILSEIQFNKLKIILRDLKIKQLMKRRHDVLNQTDPEFMAKQRELLEEFNARNRLTETIRCLEMDSLERRTNGLKMIAESNQDDNKIIAQEKIRDQLLNEIRNERARHIQEKIVQSYFLDKRFDQRRELRERNHFELAAKRARLSIPLIVHQLSQDQIDADIRTADLATLKMMRENPVKVQTFLFCRMANPQLRELLDRGTRKLDLPFDNEEPVDITERFFEDCSKLALGEVVRYDSFTLGEAMSAVELMDEKMDIGMKKVTRQMGLDESKSMGLYQSNYAEQLTLWTNVLLTEPDRVLFEEHPVFSCLAHGFFHTVMLVKCVIQNASVYEESLIN